MIESTETIELDGEALSYRLYRSKKRKRSLSLKLNREGTLQINVPHTTSRQEIERFIADKYAWIQSKRNTRNCQEKIEPIDYSQGSMHLYLGKKYPLQLLPYQQSHIEFNQHSFVVFHRKNSNIESLLNHWYRQQALELFSKRTLMFQKQFNLPAVKSIKVRKMKARWGSCNSRAEITYNWHLIKATPACIDYVIIHELCHLLQPNHGAKFYQLQSQLNPYWKQHKKFLNDSANQFLHL